MKTNLAKKLTAVKSLVGRKEKSEVAELPNCEELAQRMIARKVEMDALEAEHKLDEEELRNLSLSHMWHLEESGQVVKSVQSCGLLVSRKNQFKPLDPEFYGTFADAFGKKIADQLLEPSLELKVRKGQAEKLLAACEKAGINLSEFCDVEKSHRPSKEFIDRRAALRGSMSAEKNQALDEVAKDVSYSPSISYKEVA